MFAENDIVEDAASTENITNRMWFSGHVFDIYDLRGNIAWSTATNEEIVRVVCDCSQAEVDYYGLFTKDDIVWLEISMYYISSWHLGQSSKNTFKNEFPLINCILWQIIESSTNRISLDVLKS